MKKFGPKIAPAPKGLSEDSRKLWREILAEFGIEDVAGKWQMQTALECRDEMRTAQEALKKHGPVTTDRWGQLRSNPAAAIVRDARAGMMAAIKSLNLDLEPLRDKLRR